MIDAFALASSHRTSAFGLRALYISEGESVIRLPSVATFRVRGSDARVKFVLKLLLEVLDVSLPEFLELLRQRDAVLIDGRVQQERVSCLGSALAVALHHVIHLASRRIGGAPHQEVPFPQKNIDGIIWNVLFPENRACAV